MFSCSPSGVPSFAKPPVELVFRISLATLNANFQPSEARHASCKPGRTLGRESLQISMGRGLRKWLRDEFNANELALQGNMVIGQRGRGSQNVARLDLQLDATFSSVP